MEGTKAGGKSLAQGPTARSREMEVPKASSSGVLPSHLSLDSAPPGYTGGKGRLAGWGESWNKTRDLHIPPNWMICPGSLWPQFPHL